MKTWDCTNKLHTLVDSNGIVTVGSKVKFYKWWMQNIPGSNTNIASCPEVAPPNGTHSLGNWWDYLRGDYVTEPPETNCHPTPIIGGTGLSGLVSASPISGATITLYTLEAGGVLAPVTLSGSTATAADGTYLTPALPTSLNGQTLVVKATGGSFVDEATGQAVSFAGRSLYAVIPSVELGGALGGVVTPFTDMAFRMAKHTLTVDPSRVPATEASYYNFWVANFFGLRAKLDVNSPFGDSPFAITLLRPFNFYSGQSLVWGTPETTYTLALAGLSQQAANAGLSPVVWIDQLSADADDGVFNGASRTSWQTLQTAVDTYLAGPRSPLGTTFTVTKTTDTNDGACNSDCSLREAIVAANLTGGPDSIILSAGTYALTRTGSDDNANNGDLDLTSEITLVGAGANKTIIAGGSGWTDRIFHVITTTIQINSLTIQGGNKTNSSGGGIYSTDSALTLSNVAISSNTTTNTGGGIYFIGGALTLIDSIVSGNTANDTGGGIRNVGGTAILTNVTISGNTAKNDAGGIRTASNGSMPASLTLTNVTITNNTADSDSNGTGEGGGLYRSSGTATFKNTIIAGNFDNSTTTKRPDCSGSITSQGYNLVGNNTGCTFTSTTGDQVGTGGSPVNPLLGVLQDNGGQTLTHALLAGSPARDTGTNTDCPSTDQRSTLRPQGTVCDKGAYEVAAVLDNFNRANGGIGSNWSGNTGSYVIASNRLDPVSGGDIYWNVTQYGANQEAYVTLVNIDPAGQEVDLMLKSQSASGWTSGGAGRLEVWYNPATHVVKVVTYTSTQNWVQCGADIPVAFVNGDQFGARALADGRVLVYRNGVLLATRDVTAWPYYTNGGYIGLWTIGASNSLLDDFGGGGVNEP
ncbi:MAG: CSLREA domain-containing protein [Chloroflexi bacterium]|nr:CSLREA domain-containing protein [Chloroflexota bacterium]